MKHLKNIKERRSNQQSEFDLRGLGDTSAIRAEYPQTHLSVQIKNFETIKQVSSIFSLDFKKSNAHKNVFHLYSPRHDLNHKEKSIILFAAALYVSHVDTNAHMLMNEISQLAKLIKNESPNGSEDRDANVVAWVKDPQHLSMHPGMQLYLGQAGFAIDPQGEFQSFQRDQLTLLRTQTSKSISQNHNRKKVVGE